MKVSSGYDLVKRLVDVGVAAVAVIVSLPLQGVVAILVYKNLGRPVLFRQPRPGKDGRVFMLRKFRSMSAPGPGEPEQSDATRLTGFGRALRASSLDELPSLWNVLTGDMSLVGPRPLLLQYMERYTPEQLRRHEVRPGITGLAQVKGRNGISWDEKFRLDVEYVNSRSLALDLRIIAATVVKVLRREGISEPGMATMTEFTGYPKDGSRIRQSEQAESGATSS
jgi:lipopolysaccharide/colanic/teichoic acid biosynthesis glycosyltransferase